MADKKITIESVTNAYNEAATINGKLILGGASTILFVAVIIGVIAVLGIQNIMMRLKEEGEDKNYLLFKTAVLIFSTISAALIFIMFVTV